MINLQGVSTRRSPLALANVNLAWGPGVHAIVGAPTDGGPALLALTAGTLRPRQGRVRVLDGAPTDPRVRKRMAYVPLDAGLPDGLRVDEVLALAAALRGDPAAPASDRLAVLGVESLARRPVRSLSPAEARTVALAEAFTSSDVRAILVEEPLIAIDPRASVRVAEWLRTKGREGCAVVVATGSLRDASLLTDDFVLMTRGAAGPPSSFAALAGVAPRGARLLIMTRDIASAQALVAELAHDAGAFGIAYSGPTRGSAREAIVIRIQGRDPVVLARAAARAAVAAAVDIVQLSIEPPSLDGARAASVAARAPLSIPGLAPNAPPPNPGPP